MANTTRLLPNLNLLCEAGVEEVVLQIRDLRLGRVEPLTCRPLLRLSQHHIDEFWLPDIATKPFSRAVKEQGWHSDLQVFRCIRPFSCHRRRRCAGCKTGRGGSETWPNPRSSRSRRSNTTHAKELDRIEHRSFQKSSFCSKSVIECSYRSNTAKLIKRRLKVSIGQNEGWLECPIEHTNTVDSPFSSIAWNRHQGDQHPVCLVFTFSSDSVIEMIKNTRSLRSHRSTFNHPVDLSNKHIEHIEETSVHHPVHAQRTSTRRFPLNERFFDRMFLRSARSTTWKRGQVPLMGGYT